MAFLTFSQEFAAVTAEMAQQLMALHAPERTSSSRMT